MGGAVLGQQLTHPSHTLTHPIFLSFHSSLQLFCNSVHRSYNKVENKIELFHCTGRW